MKDNYLNELERLLIENNVSDKDEILEKYRKRYEFGIESEMTEEEIESMLGTPEDVLKKYTNDTTSSKNEGEVIKCDIIVRTVADDVTIDSFYFHIT